MNNLRNIKIGRIQLFLLIVVWLLIFTLPLLFVENWDSNTWAHILKIWSEYAIVFIVFLINRFIFVPKLLFKNKRLLYLVSVILTVGALTFTLYVSDSQDAVSHRNLAQNPTGMPVREPRMTERPMNGRRQGDNVHPMPERGRPQAREMANHLPPPMNLSEEIIPPFANILIISILMLGFDTGLVFFSKWIHSEQNKLKIEKESIENKMAFLQNQISPHFFMNTLNNIHALVDISHDEAKEAIIRLSKMMSYMLYESQTEKISIKQELDFIHSYVDLMRLRFTDDIDITIDIATDIPQKTIAPLLTISFIENAFKHGISYEHPSYVHISYRFTDKVMTFAVSNSSYPKKSKDGHSGIGLDNARKRLALIYPNDHILDIELKDKNKFEVKLNIPL